MSKHAKIVHFDAFFEKSIFLPISKILKFFGIKATCKRIIYRFFFFFQKKREPCHIIKEFSVLPKTTLFTKHTTFKAVKCDILVKCEFEMWIYFLTCKFFCFWEWSSSRFFSNENGHVSVLVRFDSRAKMKKSYLIIIQVTSYNIYI